MTRHLSEPSVEREVGQILYRDDQLERRFVLADLPVCFGSPASGLWTSTAGVGQYRPLEYVSTNDVETFGRTAFTGTDFAYTSMADGSIVIKRAGLYYFAQSCRGNFAAAVSADILESWAAIAYAGNPFGFVESIGSTQSVENYKPTGYDIFSAQQNLYHEEFLVINPSALPAYVKPYFRGTNRTYDITAHSVMVMRMGADTLVDADIYTP